MIPDYFRLTTIPICSNFQIFHRRLQEIVGVIADLVAIVRDKVFHFLFSPFFRQTNAAEWSFVNFLISKLLLFFNHSFIPPLILHL